MKAGHPIKKIETQAMIFMDAPVLLIVVTNPVNFAFSARDNMDYGLWIVK